MKIYHIRNATCVIEAAGHRILVDPMLSDKGELPLFSFLRFKMERNPVVPLPSGTFDILESVSHCFITHSQTFIFKPLQHTDHLDAKGEKFLVDRNIPVICRSGDAAYLKKYGMQVTTALDYWVPEDFTGGKITAVPAKHGHGWNHHLMANGAGFFLQLPGEPSLYICGDTVYTEDVARALDEFRPDICIAPAGSAQLDIGPPILMSIDEIIQLTEKTAGKVVLNHLEALNHCPTRRKELREKMKELGLSQKVLIPEDGELCDFDN